MQALAASTSSRTLRAPSSRAVQRTHTVRVHASVVRPPIQPPKGVTLPTQLPLVAPPTNGFVENAERLNSRAAMIGFFSLIALEAVAGKGILELLGLTVGTGLGFEL